MGETLVYGDGIQRGDVVHDMATEYQWVDITDKINTTPVSVSRINLLPNESLFGSLNDKCGIRWRQEGGYNYCMSTYGLGNPEYLTLMGSLLSLSSSISELYYSNYVSQMNLIVRGAYGDGQELDLLGVDESLEVRWAGARCYIVGARAEHVSGDSTGNPYVNVRINGFTIFGSMQMSDSTGEHWLDSSGINTARYELLNGDKITVSCETAGGTGDAQNLTVILKLVYR